MFNDYYTYKEMAAAGLIVLVVVAVVIYYANMITKFNKRVREITSLNDRLTELLNRESDLQEELLYCNLESRRLEIENELKSIDREWNEVVCDLKKISLED